jgi:hypothetical protein
MNAAFKLGVKVSFSELVRGFSPDPQEVGSADRVAQFDTIKLNEALELGVARRYLKKVDGVYELDWKGVEWASQQSSSSTP